MNDDILDMLDELERPAPGAPPLSEEFIRALRKARRKHTAGQFVYTVSALTLILGAVVWFYNAIAPHHAAPPATTPPTAVADAPSHNAVAPGVLTPSNLASRVTLIAIHRANADTTIDNIQLPELPPFDPFATPLFTHDDAARLR